MDYYTARKTGDGRCFVLHPDGLSWEPPFFAEFAEAERHAADLNAWLDAKPDGGGPVLIHETFVEPAPDELVPPSASRLLLAIDRLYNSERRLNGLAASLGLS